MSERLSDEHVGLLAHPQYEDRFLTDSELTLAFLAREVQERRKNDWANDLTHLKLSVDMLNVRDLCIRHDITVEGIVALVDEVMDERNDTFLFAPAFFRRLARGEEA